MKAGGQDLVPMTRKQIKDMQDEIERLSAEGRELRALVASYILPSECMYFDKERVEKHIQAYHAAAGIPEEPASTQRRIGPTKSADDAEVVQSEQGLPRCAECGNTAPAHDFGCNGGFDEPS